MIKRNFEEIKQMLGTEQSVCGDESLLIEGVSTDSRTMSQGNLFIPLAGVRFDGHQYVEEVMAKGAAASLWQMDHPNPPKGVPLIFVENTLTALQELARSYRSVLPVRVIGITGSNGKTTTKDMVASILSTTYRVHKTQGNLNNHIGLPLTLLQLDETTEMAVVEMGMSSRGEIEFLSKLAMPEAAIITNIGESHLMQLGTREEIAKAKLEILSGLQEDGLFVYNGDEPLLDQLTFKANNKYLRFGEKQANDLYPVGVMIDSEQAGTYFRSNLPNSSTYFIPLLGVHNVINALAAIAVSKYMGVAESDIAAGLKTMKATGMRIEKVKCASGLTILNDAYNASPTSMRAALELLHELKGYGKKIIVLGDMLELGDQEERFHREIGGLLDPEVIDYVFTCGELARFIALEAEGKHTFMPERIIYLEDKDEIVRRIGAVAEANDVLLVKASRGMRFETIVAGLKNHPLGRG